jgi:hypothetical protein
MKMKQRWVIAIGLMFGFLKFAQGIELSDSAKISLLTVAPGKELYSTFGHSGIRIQDSDNNIDIVFNYGTFDFNQPNFYINFVKGRLLYMLEVSSFQNFLEMYEYEERSVFESVLLLEKKEKQNILDFLLHNARPENKNYRYEFFFDNCATRIRDVFEKELGNKLQYNSAKLDTTKTLRKMLDIYVEHKPWIKLGFYLILGLPSDVRATPRMQAFLPDYLKKLIETASVTRGDTLAPLVIKKQALLKYESHPDTNDFFTPKITLLFFLIFILIVSLVEPAIKRRFVLLDFLLFFSAGLLGWFLIGMWVFTEHYAVPKNLNVLWANPFFLPLSFLLFFKKLDAFHVKWLHVSWIWLLVLLPIHQLLPQSFHPSVSIIMIILGFRAWTAIKAIEYRFRNES